MAVSPVGTAAPHAPFAIQAQATEFREVESNTRRVQPLDEARSTPRDVGTLTQDRTDQGRPDRSGHSVKAGTSEGSDTGADRPMRGESANARGARETPARNELHDNSAIRSDHSSSTARVTLPEQGPSQIVARIEIQNPVFDRQKSNLFVDRLDEVRAQGTLASSELETRETSQASTLEEATEITSGRFNKRA